MILDEKLLYNDQSVSIHDSREIPILGFGSSSMAGTFQEQYVTLERTRAFHLPACGHFITAASDIGGLCAVCFDQVDLFEVLSPEWLFQVCVRCFQRCSSPECRIGLCPAHCGQDSNDERWYCHRHLEERATEASLAEIGSRHGRLVAAAARVGKSVIYGDRSLLK